MNATAKTPVVPSVVAAAVYVILLGGCIQSGYNAANYQSAVRSGFSQIPEALQIEELLGTADHFISGQRGRDGARTWTTVVYFEGRYVLSMQVKVRTDADFSTIVEVVSDPQFTLHEVSQVDDYGGNIGASFKGSSEKHFGRAEWQKLVASHGDWTGIGINIVRGKPIRRFDEYVQAKRDDLIVVRPAVEPDGSPAQ